MPAEKPQLRVVRPQAVARESQELDSISRESHLRMIRSLRKAYRAFGVDLLVHQATLGKAGIDDLSDRDLVALHRDLDRARECIQDDVTFEDAGLLRSQPQTENWQ